MYFEAMVPLPMGDDTAEFEQNLKDAQTAGATVVRAACLGTRRYEAFKSLDDWHVHVNEKSPVSGSGGAAARKIQNSAGPGESQGLDHG